MAIDAAAYSYASIVATIESTLRAMSAALAARAAEAARAGSSVAMGGQAISSAALLGRSGFAVGQPAAAPQPTAAVGAVGTGAALLGSMQATLGTSAIASQVFATLAQNHARIDSVDDAEFAARFGRAVGVYVPDENRILMPTSVMQRPDQAALVMVHEGVHWLQDNVQGGAAAIGGPLQQALAGANAIRATTPGTATDRWHEETQAYIAEALAANESGLVDHGLGASGSRALSYEQTFARVAAEPIYN